VFSNNNWVQVYPYIQTATTNGIYFGGNPAYNTAPYEVSFIFHTDVWESVQQVRP
jgi:hypothetical protein